MTSGGPPPSVRPLVGAGVLARNTAWNLVGLVAPMVAALVSIPVLVSRLGSEGFGVLGLAWMLVGYFSLFDLGLSRALTMLVAERLGRGRQAEVSDLVWTALSLMLALGLVGAGGAAVLTPWVVDRVLHVPPSLADETRRAFYLMELAIPAVTCAAGLRGVLEANQRFGLVNLLRAPMGILSYAGPALMVLVTRRIDAAVGVLMVARYAGLAAHAIVTRRALPGQMGPPGFRRDLVRPLLSFGGWMSVSNVISPLLMYFDRFAVGAWLSVAAVGYYVTPYEIATKLWLIPGALVTVLFPAFSASVSLDPAHGARLAHRGLRYVWLATFPPSLLLVTGAHLLLTVWVGDEMAREGSRVLQWLALGTFLNGLAAVPFALLQGLGRPDLTAKLHVAELPGYGLLLWWGIATFGIDGAAMAWTVRVGADLLLLLWLARQALPGSVALGRAVAGIVAMVAWMAIGAFTGSTMGGATFLAVSVVAGAVLAWRMGLDEEERRLVREKLQVLRGAT